MMPPKKFTASLLSVFASLFAVTGFAVEQQPSTEKSLQSALVFDRSGMAGLLDSSSIRVPGLPLIFSSQIRIACASVPAWKDNILAYLPETATCVPFSALSSSSQRNFTIETGRDDRIIDRIKISQALQEKPYQLVRVSALAESFTVLQSEVTVAGVCSCPGNAAPTIRLVSGGGQVITVNSPIGDIVFSASDQDSDVLTDFFSYKLNDGVAIDGLPAGLSKNCNSGIGTLECTVSGTAPDSSGTYSIILDVFDGFNTTSETANIIVNEAQPETVFKNGFETLR